MDWFLLISLAIIAFGYGLYSLVLPNRAQQLPKPSDEEWPGVSFVIPAYNEEQFLAKKIENTLRSIYPKEKLEIIIAADGSTDNSQKVCADFPVRFENNGERAGKSAAMNRAAAYAKHEILIFSDANALLNPEAIREIVRPLLLPQYAMSSGEKKVIKKEEGENASEGEGLYWKYESFLKQKDSNFYTLLGAVGELFGMKKSHFVEIPKNFLVDDFYEAACILQQGYQIRYVPEAVATEYGSLNFKEEIKRKIRISAGGYQSIFHFKSLFNPLKNWKVSYIFIAHRVLRWTLIPLLYFSLPLYAVVMALVSPSTIYFSLAIAALLYGLCNMVGYWYNVREKKAPFFANIPFYISLMNYCALAGAIRYFKGIQSGAWEKVQRAG